MTREGPAIAPAHRVVQAHDRVALARTLTRLERADPAAEAAVYALDVPDDLHIIGITGPPGAGKSSLIDALIGEYRRRDVSVAVLAVDPSSPLTGGALLGDRLRMMGHAGDPGVFIRSIANKGRLGGLAPAVHAATRAVAAAGFSRVLLETVGVGQAEVDVGRQADTTVVVSIPGTGDSIQAEKAGLLEVADVLVVNKSDREGAGQAARDLRAMINLGGRDHTNWTPPVIETCALSGIGVGAFVEAAERHRDALESAGALAGARARRDVTACQAAATAMLNEMLNSVVASRSGQAVLEGVATGRLAPLAAASRLVSEVSSAHGA